MHRGWYPLVDNQAFRRVGPAAARAAATDGRPPDNRHPVEKAVEHLAEDVPAEDAGVDGVVGDDAAGASRRHVGAQRLGARQGRDLRPRHDHAESRRRRTSSRPTATLSRTRAPARRSRAPAASIVYTGFQWRGRSSTAGRDDSALREVMFVDRDWRTMEGRWFTGGYDEIGIDVKLERVGAETRVLGTDRTALQQRRAGAGAEDLRRQSAGDAAAAPTSISVPASPSRASSVRRPTSPPSSVDVAADRRGRRARSVRRRRVAAEGARRLRQDRHASR